MVVFSCCLRERDVYYIRHSFPTRRSSDLNWWSTGTPWIGVNWNFERRIGLHPAGFDRDGQMYVAVEPGGVQADAALEIDRKSTRLNSSHRTISYAVFCLKKKKKKQKQQTI